ncbi:UNVERIFIED_CONTAM: hypothetical protein K2H54_038066 [Gekko kuhli]
MLPHCFRLLDELPDSVTRWAPPGTSCGEIATFLKNASELAYDEKPGYEMLKRVLSSGLEHRGHCYPFSFITVTSALTEHAAKPRKTDLPKLTPKPGKETKENKQENKKLACQRKAPARTEDEQLLATVSKPLQTKERKEPPPGTCLFHKKFQKIEEKSMQNGITNPPVCQPLPSSSECSTPVLSEELYQYIIAIVVLLLLIPLSLYYL